MSSSVDQLLLSISSSVTTYPTVMFTKNVAMYKKWQYKKYCDISNIYMYRYGTCLDQPSL